MKKLKKGSIVKIWYWDHEGLVNEPISKAGPALIWSIGEVWNTPDKPVPHVNLVSGDYPEEPPEPDTAHHADTVTILRSTIRNVEVLRK